MEIGPFQPGNIIRIPWLISINGTPTDVSSPRVQRLILPDQSNASGFPKTMTALSTGLYFLEITGLLTIGNYTAVLQGELTDPQTSEVRTVEELAEFIIEKPFGFPRIQIACD